MSAAIQLFGETLSLAGNLTTRYLLRTSVDNIGTSQIKKTEKAPHVDSFEIKDVNVDLEKLNVIYKINRLKEINKSLVLNKDEIANQIKKLENASSEQIQTNLGIQHLSLEIQNARKGYIEILKNNISILQKSIGELKNSRDLLLKEQNEVKEQIEMEMKKIQAILIDGKKTIAEADALLTPQPDEIKYTGIDRSTGV